MILCIVGNKFDLESSRQVSYEEGKEFAEKKRAMFFEVSAMNGKNVTELFTEMTRKIKSAQPVKQEDSGAAAAKVDVSGNSAPVAKKRSFC